MMDSQNGSGSVLQERLAKPVLGWDDGGGEGRVAGMKMVVWKLPISTGPNIIICLPATRPSIYQSPGDLGRCASLPLPPRSLTFRRPNITFNTIADDRHGIWLTWFVVYTRIKLESLVNL
ncbi:hypothetical protein FRB93_009087 [Tulasnella sp. JGI-2019a]|nr:hypothetical protein FRB93_009087 [Tulasnella sp. JGI-2019a]